MQNLDNRTPIVNPDGTPTEYFMRMFQVRADVIDGKVDSSRQVLTSSPLMGGGDLSTDRTLGMEPSGVTPDTYTAPIVTFDEFGRAVTVSEGSYIFGFFVTTAPTADEVLYLHMATRAFTFADEFAGSLGSVGSNPSATYTITVARQVGGAGAFSTIGTITVSTDGAVSFATTGTTVAIASGDVLKFTGQTTTVTGMLNLVIAMVGGY